MKPFSKTLLATFISSAVVITGCSNDESSDDASEASSSSAPEAELRTHPVTGETLAEEQVFTWWQLDEHSSFDPQVAEDTMGAMHARNLFEGLLNQDADGNLIPGVAERYEASEDNKTYTFYLREDAKWSNGEQVKAGDFVFAWKRAVDPELASPYAWYMEIMSIENGGAIIAGEMDPEALGIRAIDDTTLEIKLEDALPYFPSMVTHATTFPVHPATVEEFGDEWTKPENMVSNGAYKLTTHVVNERVEMVRNENYWDNEDTIIDEVISIVVPDVNQALIRWKADEFDWLEEVPTGQFKSLQEEFPNEIFATPRLCSYYYYVNLRDDAPEFLRDERVRKALAYAIDRNVITDQILQAGQFPAYTFTPGATANFEVPDVAWANMTQEELDAEAVRLLEEAGYADGFEVEILYNTSESHKTVATAISQMWKTKLGVDAKLNNLEWTTYLTERSEGNFELSRAGWCGDYNEASTFLDLMRSESGYNDGKYVNLEVDSLMDEAKSLADPNPNYTRVEEIIADEMAVLPIYHYTFNIALKDDVKGWPFYNVEGNWYAKDLYKVAE